jgi:hypothetical protein
MAPVQFVIASHAAPDRNRRRTEEVAVVRTAAMRCGEAFSRAALVKRVARPKGLAG